MTPTSPLFSAWSVMIKGRGHAHKDEGHFCLKLSDDGFCFPISSSLANTIIKLLSPLI